MAGQRLAAQAVVSEHSPLGTLGSGQVEQASAQAHPLLQVLSTYQVQLQQAEAENSRLQLQVKLLHEECAFCLQRCARKAAVSIGRVQG